MNGILVIGSQQQDKKDSVLCPDGWKTYREVASRLRAEYRSLRQNNGKPTIDGVFYIQNAHVSCHSRLKSWYDQFHGIADKNLDEYIGWHRLIERVKSLDVSDIVINPTTFINGT